MRREDVASFVVFAIMIAAALIVGLTVVPNVINVYAPNNMNTYLFVILILITGFILNVVGLELLHALGAKIGGYKAVSVNILHVHFEDGKVSLKDYDGLTGETKIAPKKETVDLKPYIWTPIFGFAAEIATCIVLYTRADELGNGSWLAVVSILYILISSMIALYNLVPIKLDSMTDGYRLILLTNKSNTNAYNELLRIEDLERNGKEATDIKIFEEITEFTANLNLISVYHNLSTHNYEEAEKLIDMILADTKKLQPNTYNHVVAEKIYIKIMAGDKEEAKQLYNKLADDKVRRYIANDKTMPSIRAYVLIAGILEGSQNEVNLAISKLEKARKNTLKTRLEKENKLYDEALEKVYSLHPDWKKENVAA